jgi:hypothetical protein
MKPANNAPLYAGFYSELAEITRKHGYCLAVHGSLARDLDLIAVPWTDEAPEAQVVVDAILAEFALQTVGAPSIKSHGRICYTLVVSFGDCFIDLSFMPLLPKGSE